jgi:PAS domain S-box-containing protein
MSKRGKSPRDSGESISPWRDLGESIVGGTPDVIMLLDPKTYEILAVNEVFEKTYGLPKGEWKGKRCYQVTHNREAPCSDASEACPVLHVLQEGTSHTVEHCHRDSKGQDRYCEVVVYPIHGPRGGVEKLFHTVRDITQRKKMEQQLIRAERISAISQLVTTIAHEINNPLAGLLLAVKGLSRTTRLLPDELKYIKRLEEAAGRIRDAIKKLEHLDSEKTKEYIRGLQMIDLNDEE